MAYLMRWSPEQGPVKMSALREVLQREGKARTIEDGMTQMLKVCDQPPR